jgi:ABC-2 type transport system ATP-binding protein
VVRSAGDINPVQVTGLHKRYEDVVAVRNVDLEIQQGEVFALLGPNGAGKTTTVEILEGIRQRTSGEVRVLGCDPAEDRRTWRSRIGVVPQTTGSYTDLTVREVVEHFAAFYPDPLPIGQVLDMVGLGAHERKAATALSGGQQRRLDVAVGVVGDPDLIFLDEPTTGLDPVARREAWDLVRYFADLGRTTVLTTHYLDEAEALAQRAAVIVDGEVAASGTMAEIGGRAHTPTTVSFRLTAPLARRGLPALPPDALVEHNGMPGDGGAAAGLGLVTVLTHEPSQLLALLLAWAREEGVVELPELSVHRPTLEEVYLQMIRDHRARRDRSRAAEEAACP